MGARGRAAGAALVVAAAVLLALGGPARGGDGADSDASTPASDARASADPGRALFVRMACGSCHKLAAGAGIGPIGPDLDVLLPNYDAASLRAKIVDPYPAGTAESFAAMPEDFGRRMSARELDELVEFLLGTVRR